METGWSVLLMTSNWARPLLARAMDEMINRDATSTKTSAKRSFLFTVILLIYQDRGRTDKN
jgi:hypothetical protein